MSEIFQRVCAMNEAFGNPKGDPESINWQRLQTQAKGALTEVRELESALADRDIEAVRDALCDVMVFAHGGHHAMGVVDIDYPLVAPRSEQVSAFALGQCVKDLRDDAAYLVQMCAHKSNPQGVHAMFSQLILACLRLQSLIGVDSDADMNAVIDGVLTRFCQDEESLRATCAKYANLGIEFVIEGSFPTVCLKSAFDQGDEYPKGKFLKSVGYSQAVFPELRHAVAAV